MLSGLQPIILAHNFQGCDRYLVINAYHHQCVTIQQVWNSGNILQLTEDNPRFVDSMSFFQMPLSAFPKTFCMTKLRKGYFPKANTNYVGLIPNQSFYVPQGILSSSVDSSRPGTLPAWLRDMSLTSKRNSEPTSSQPKNH